jgi:glucose/arabinose dehydrogenase
VAAKSNRLVAAALAALAALPAAAQTIRSEAHAFRVVELVRGLEQPWALAFLPDGRMLVTEKAGRLRVVEDGRLDPRPVAGLPEFAVYGQGGLMDVAPHPRFRENGWIYLTFAARGAGGVGTEVARGRLKDHRLEDVQVIFRQSPKGSTGRHFGSRLAFDRQGYLYVTLGDRGEMERAQKPGDHAGSVIRLHDDGRVPRDNPFVGKPGWKAEKFTLGNRNQQGAALHPRTGVLWTHEHGPQGGDEVNVIRAGANYGWPVITYGVQYVIGTQIGEGTAKPGMEQPLHKWVPSIAPSGMAFYTGDRFPGWRTSLFVGALKAQLLVRLELDGEKVVREERLLEGVLGRIRDVRAGPDGFLYLLTDASPGVLARLEPAG